jgi:hypothetical protein
MIAASSNRPPALLNNSGGQASRQRLRTLFRRGLRDARAAFRRPISASASDKNGVIMTVSRVTPAGDRIIDPMLALASCSKQHRIVVAGSRGVELMLELQRRGYARAAATANCGHPAGQYDVALVDWRRRTFKTLEVALDWLVEFLSPTGMLVVWVDPQKAAANEALRLALQRRGFVIEGDTVHDCGCAVSARRRETYPVRKAA